MDLNAANPRTINWRAELHRKRVDYQGEEVFLAETLTLEQIRPGLPSNGIAASLDAASVATGFARAVLRGNRSLAYALASAAPPNVPLIGISPAAFRIFFANACKQQRLAHFEFRPYSSGAAEPHTIL